MSGPWEKYQKQTTEGPWTKYQDKPTESPIQEKGLIRRGAEAVIDSPALPIIGGVTGAIAGAGVGSVPMAALGGAAGESFRQLAARSLGMDSPINSAEAANKIGVEGITQGAGQAIGMGVGKLGSLAAKTQAGKVVIGGVKKAAGDVFQLATKLNPKNAATLYENPKSFLPASMKAAKEEWKAAAKEIGLPVDKTTPEYIKALKDPNTAFDTFEKITKGESVTPLEAQIARKVVKIRLRPAAVNERNRELVAQYDLMNNSFQKVLSEASPRMAEANKNYAIASAGKSFRSVFPRNQNDTPAYFRSSFLPLLLGGQSIYQDGNAGDVLKYAAAGTAATSPLTYGSLIALLGAGKNLGPYVAKSAVGSLAELAKQRFQRK